MSELELRWFPWCTSHYVDSFVREKMAELKASGEHFGVRNVNGQIQILVARNPHAWRDGKLVEPTYLTRQEAVEAGLV